MIRWLFFIGIIVLIGMGAWPIVEGLLGGTNIGSRQGSLGGRVNINNDLPDNPIDTLPAEPPELPQDDAGMFN